MISVYSSCNKFLLLRYSRMYCYITSMLASVSGDLTGIVCRGDGIELSVDDQVAVRCCC